MTDKTFNAVFASLSSYYRLEDKPDKNARLEYFKAVQFVDDSDARSLYSDIVNKYAFFPKIPEVKELAEKYRKARVTYRNENFCYFCCNLGLIHYSKKGIEPFPDLLLRIVPEPVLRSLPPMQVLLGAAGMAGCAVVEYTAVPALLEGLAKLLQ